MRESGYLLPVALYVNFLVQDLNSWSRRDTQQSKIMDILNLHIFTFKYLEDAEDAVYYLDGSSLFGCALKVQLAQSNRKSK